MFLITQFWKFNDPARKREVLDCLIKNTKNRSIKKIFVFHEPDSDSSLTHNKIVNIQTKNKLSYLDMMRYAEKVSDTTPFIIANADIWFDNLTKLNGYKFDKSMIALSSYWDNDITDFSFDSFIFKPSIVDTINFNTYSPGTSHDDLRFLRCLIKSGIDVRNPSLDIKSIHLDNKRGLKMDIKEVFDYIEPSKINKTIVTIKNNYNSIKNKVDKFESLKQEKIELVKRLNDIRLQEIQTEDFRLKAKIKQDKERLRKELNNLPFEKYKASYDDYVKDYISDKKDLVIILHLYYQDMWEEIKAHLDNITIGFDLYITMTKNSSTIGQIEWMETKIKNDYPDAQVYVLPNKGLDIGPFMYCLDEIFKTDKNYKYLIKIHSKKSIETSGLDAGEKWRNDLIRPLIGSESVFKSNIDIFEKNIDIGMIGSNKWLTSHLERNRDTIDYYKKELGIEKSSDFIGGTIFMGRYEIFKKYFKTKTIKFYDELEEGYFKDHNKPTKTHALERIMGYIVIDSNKKIVGV